MKRIVFLIFVLFLLSVGMVSAHVGGGPPFLEINGKYALTNPFFSNDPAINIPQDTNPETAKLFVNQPIHFAIDTDKLLVPPEVAAASTFRWTMDENSTNHLFGKSFTFQYKETGSHLITLEAKGPNETDFLVIDTIQADILPDANYHLPKASIAVATNNRDSIKPILFKSSIHSDPSAKITKMIWGFGDGQNSTDANSLHHYNNAANYATFPVVFRIVDSHKFFSDAGVVVQVRNGKFSFIDANGKENTIPVSDKIEEEKKQPKPSSFNPLFIIVGLGIAILGVIVFLYKSA